MSHFQLGQALEHKSSADEARLIAPLSASLRDEIISEVMTKIRGSLRGEILSEVRGLISTVKEAVASLQANVNVEVPQQPPPTVEVGAPYVHVEVPDTTDATNMLRQELVALRGSIVTLTNLLTRPVTKTAHRDSSGNITAITERRE